MSSIHVVEKTELHSFRKKEVIKNINMRLKLQFSYEWGENIALWLRRILIET